MRTEAGGEGCIGIGARLRAARERSGFSALQASERLHIDPYVIEALESEDFQRLGAPVYARGHLRRYAEMVGEDVAEMDRQYAESAQAVATPDLTRIARGAPARDRQSLAAPGLAMLIAVAVIGLTWWILDSLEPTPLQVPANAEQLAPDEAPPEVVPVPVVAQPPGETQAATRKRPAPKPRAERTEMLDVVPAAARPTPRVAELTLRFSEDSWVEVYDASGNRLIYDIGSADTTRTFSGSAPLRVVLGNAPGVHLEVNGRPTAIPDAVLRESEARFVVNRSGRLVRSRVAAGSTSP